MHQAWNWVIGSPGQWVIFHVRSPCCQNAQRLSGSVLLAKRPVTVENADEAKFQENSIEHRLVTDIERQVDRQTDSRLHLVPEQCYAVVGTNTDMQIPTDSLPVDINASMRSMHAMRPIYLSDTVSLGINHIHKLEYADKKRHRLSQSELVLRILYVAVTRCCSKR